MEIPSPSPKTGCIHVIGLDCGFSDKNVLLKNMALLQSCDLLCAWKSMFEKIDQIFPSLPQNRYTISLPLEYFWETLRIHLQKGETIGVLADGDPLYFGIGESLSRVFRKESLCIHPAVSSLQLAASRLAIPLSSLAHVSWHGRDAMTEFNTALFHKKRIALLCDPHHSPLFIAKYLQDQRIHALLHVFSALGTPKEQYTSFYSHTPPAHDPPSPSIVILERDVSMRPHLGLSQSHFGSDYTSNIAVRATALALLEISPWDTVWDIGSGSGAVALEACALAHHGRVFAVEKDRERARKILERRSHLNADILEVLCGNAPECLESLPRPNKIFLGGGLSQNATALLSSLLEALSDDGSLVINCVLLRSLEVCRQFFAEHHMEISIHEMQLSTSSPLSSDIFLKARNPVFLLSYKRSSS